jgi:hypothetical protein
MHNTRLGVIMPTGMMNAIDKDQLVFAGVAHRIVQNLQELMAIHHNGRIGRMKLIEHKH